MPANETIVVTPVATDVDGNALPTPGVSYTIAPRQTPFKGTMPTISGNAITAGAATMGSFIVTATDTLNGRGATAEFAVVLPADASGGELLSLAGPRGERVRLGACDGG